MANRIPIQVNGVASGNPGDEFSFTSTSNNTQFRITVTGAGPDVVIGVWGPNNDNLGKARNKAGQNYVDRTLSSGLYRITVQNAIGPFTVAVKNNSLWHKWFGW